MQWSLVVPVLAALTLVCPVAKAEPGDPIRAASAFAPIVTAPVRTVRVHGATLGYRTAGHGRPLVLVPGFGFTMAEWDPDLLAALSDGRRLILFDNRGAGTSTGSVTGLTVERMARDTRALIRTLTSGRADVLGWSMGSYIAQELALRWPRRVRRLVLASADPGGPCTVPPRPWALRILSDPDTSAQQLLQVLYPRGQGQSGADWLTRVGQAFGANGYQPANAFSVPATTMAAQERAAGPRWLRPGGGVLGRLHLLRKPVLIGAGRKDVITPVGNVRLLRRALVRRTVVTYADAGHAFLFQHARGFGTRVNAFLRAP